VGTQPKVKTKFGQENKLIHPKSRKAQQISRSWHRENRVKHVKKETGIKMSLVGEKIAWFRDQLQEDSAVTCTQQKTLELIEKYLHRFDEELSQIELKYQVGGQRTSRQHASREDTIKHTMQQEKEDFETCGLGKK
jgi:translation machinery-associated protein 16